MIDDYKQGMDDLPKVKKFQCRVNNQYRYRAKIIEMIDDYKQGLDDLPEVKKF